jgi:hypothetical protein
VGKEKIEFVRKESGIVASGRETEEIERIGLSLFMTISKLITHYNTLMFLLSS